MATMKALLTRANAKCELCGGKSGLEVFEVGGAPGDQDASVLTCSICRDQMAENGSPDVHHWRCLGNAMWSEVPAVQVIAWRMLNRLSKDDWARDQLEMLYLDEALQSWANAGQVTESASSHRDCNGAQLSSGCSVTLVKDLNVKGAGFTAKRGTTVRNISLVQDNDKQIEGRISGQQIVILTEFVKKAS